MSVVEAAKIFVLGSFRDFGTQQAPTKATLERLVAGLVDLGWDAFTSGDRRSVELAGAPLSPLAMTEALEPLCDLAVYVATRTGRESGWAAELTRMQDRYPQGAAKRVVMLEDRYPLSWILDPAHGGVLASPPVLVSWWVDEEDLLTQVNAYAEFMATAGHLPEPRELWTD